MAINFDFIFGHSDKNEMLIKNWIGKPSRNCDKTVLFLYPGPDGGVKLWDGINDPNENKPLINPEDILAFRPHPNKNAEEFKSLHPDYQMARQREAYEALKQQLEEEKSMRS